MTGVDVHRYCVNGKEVDLVRLAALFKVIPISNAFLKKMLNRKVIPNSMFITPSVKFKKFKVLLTMEHVELLMIWFSDITSNFTKNIRPSNEKVMDLHKAWAKINDDYCKKLGLPLEYGLEFVSKDRNKFVTKSAIAFDTVILKYAKNKGDDLADFTKTVKEMSKNEKYYSLNDYDIETIDESMEFVNSDKELAYTKKVWGTTKQCLDRKKGK